MGMFSEIHSEVMAHELEIALFAAIDSDRDSDIRFAGEYIWPFYWWHASEGGVEIPAELREMFHSYNYSMQYIDRLRKRLAEWKERT